MVGERPLALVGLVGERMLTVKLDGVQLTFDGHEVPIVNGTRGRRLSETQVRVLRYLDRRGQIRPREAGLLLYEVQSSPASRDRYASSDGCAVLGRLVRRGLVRRVERGIYESVLAP